MNGYSQLRSLIQQRVRAQDLDMKDAELREVNLSTLWSENVDLRAVDMSRTNLRNTRFSNCSLADANLQDTDWFKATLRMCVLDGAECSGAHFDSARIEDSSAKGANLTRASLHSAKLTETSFERAILREAVLDNAEGDGVEFRGADLVGATLIAAQLDEADFRGANLSDADLSRGRFHSADFRGAILDGACFENADCQGARFDEGEESAIRARSKAANEKVLTFDQMAATLLRESQTLLPTIFAAREGVAAELPDSLQQAAFALSAVSDQSLVEWETWLTSLLPTINDGQSLDWNDFSELLRNAPDSLQDIFAMNGIPTTELLDHMQQLANVLDSGADQPPEEWKPWIEPLMKMTQDGASFDPKALLDVLSSLMQDQSQKGKSPDRAAQTTASHQ